VRETRLEAPNTIRKRCGTVARGSPEPAGDAF